MAAGRVCVGTAFTRPKAYPRPQPMPAHQPARGQKSAPVSDGYPRVRATRGEPVATSVPGGGRG
jgi:hypothetical protein